MVLLVCKLRKIHTVIITKLSRRVMIPSTTSNVEVRPRVRKEIIIERQCVFYESSLTAKGKR